MVICDSFVMLNYPKTGSTFAREALREIHEASQASQSALVGFAKRILRKAGFQADPRSKS